jgi:hypothetical protein
MKYYKSVLVILLFIIILSLLYNHIYNVSEKFDDTIIPSDSTDIIIKEIVLNPLESTVPGSSSALPSNANLGKCNGSVCLSNLTFTSEYPKS